MDLMGTRLDAREQEMIATIHVNGNKGLKQLLPTGIATVYDRLQCARSGVNTLQVLSY